MDKFPIFFEIFRTIILEFCFEELFLSHIYYDALRDFVPFVLFKKREKHSWGSVTFSKACNFTKTNTPPSVFFTFLKFYKWYQIAQSISCERYMSQEGTKRVFLISWGTKITQKR